MVLVSMVASTRWWRWWCVGTMFLRPLPTPSTVSLSVGEGRCSQICWFSLDLVSWCVVQGKPFPSVWCDIFGFFIRFGHRQGSLSPNFELMVKDCNSTLLGMHPQLMFHRRLFFLLFTTGDYCGLQSLALRTFVGVPFFFCVFSPCFKFQQPRNNRSKKTTRIVFTIFLFYTRHVASSCIWFVLFFLINIRYTTLSNVFKKNEQLMHKILLYIFERIKIKHPDSYWCRAIFQTEMKWWKYRATTKKYGFSSAWIYLNSLYTFFIIFWVQISCTPKLYYLCLN